ncbi:hypothetical protein ACQWF0_25105, partial [Salmonella enterica subsp. enterica serovar Infantis]
RDVHNTKKPGAGKKISFILINPQICASLYKRAYFLKKLKDVEWIYPYKTPPTSNARPTKTTPHRVAQAAPHQPLKTAPKPP